MLAYEDRVALDDCFTLLGEDADFIGDIVHPAVPVLTYRWSSSDEIACLSPSELLQRGRDAMQQTGLTNIRSEGRHLRGDTNQGQRVKMTVLSRGGESTYFLMTAGMPGMRREAKAINRRIAALLDNPAQHHETQRQLTLSAR